MERKAHIRTCIQRSKKLQIIYMLSKISFDNFKEEITKNFEEVATNYLLHINVIIKIILMILIDSLFLVCVKPQLMTFLCFRQQLLCEHLVYFSIFVNINVQDIPKKKITSWV